MKYLIRIVLLMALTVSLTKCGNDFYTVDDFTKVRKIDTHTHLNSLHTSLAEQAVQDNFLLLTINVDVPAYPSLHEQKNFALHQIDKFPDDVKFLTAFTLQNWSSEDWAEETIAKLKTDFDEGALGIKLWKNIGMVYKDSAGQFIMIDDPKFGPVID